MVHVVGLAGANGQVGSSTAKLLAQSAKDGKIKFVVLHRAGKVPTDLENIPGVELRTFDLDGPSSDLEAAVKDINTFISALGPGALGSEGNLVDALAKSSDFVTFFPAAYSATWSAEDEANPVLGPMLKFFHIGWDKAKALGLGTTVVYTGVFDNYFFAYGLGGDNVKTNSLWVTKEQMTNRFPVTVVDHLAQGIHKIAVSDPQSIKNTEHSIITYWPTGQELADLYTKINGKPTEIKEFTAKDRAETQADAANFGPVNIGYRDHWVKGDWTYQTGGKIYNNTYDGPSIEETARKYV